jgi:selenocysteine lyase/cysteine desulfurase
MRNYTRREAVRAGGIAALFGLTGTGLVACGQDAAASDKTEEAASSEEEAQAVEEGAALPKDESTGLLARSAFVGLDAEVELVDGSKSPAINFDNGATTPSLVSVVEEIQAQLPMYGSIGRGKGQKSGHSTDVFNTARSVVQNFFGAPQPEYTLAFCGTATDGLNKISGALCGDYTTVLTTRSEHHANDLTWRHHASEVRYVEVDELGRLRMDDFEQQLAYGGIDVVSVQAASNVTGYVHDVHAIARLAHASGAIMVVDGAQIASHRAFSLKGETPEEDVDFFVCSAHKMYAPFGGGCIIGKTELMNSHVPSYRGGGMVDVVLDSDVTWLQAPDLWEAGSPNYLGQIGLAKACEALSEVGFDAIAEHEQALLRQTLDGLNGIEGVTVYADSQNIADRVGVLTFSVDNVPAADVAQKLADEFAIAVRQGEFCAHPLCHRLMGVTDDQLREAMQQPDFSAPAMVRVSFGMYNGAAEVDTLIAAVRTIAG